MTTTTYDPAEYMLCSSKWPDRVLNFVCEAKGCHKRPARWAMTPRRRGQPGFLCDDHFQRPVEDDFNT